MRRQVFIHWGLSSFTGFGVYGVNLALAWANDADLAPACSMPFPDSEVRLDPLRAHALRPVLAASHRLTAQLKTAAGRTALLDGPMLCALGDDFTVGAVHGERAISNTMIGVPFFEDARLTPDAIERARAFPHVVVGSTWNAQVLQAHGIDGAVLVLQGIDPALFHPAPRVGVLGDRFVVFSGGKLEYRKGQDIALAAFRAFAGRHPDAILAAAWTSHWPQLARTLDVSGLCAPVAFHPDGRVDAAAWAQASGVPAAQFLDLGSIPNLALPPVLREMDAALFTNRGEGGTNLVAMECMACGVPTILSANTGHRDLIDGENCFALQTQGAVAGHEGLDGVEGWGESSVDEAVEALERAYRDRDAARRVGQAGAATLANLTWGRTAAAMKDVVLRAAT